MQKIGRWMCLAVGGDCPVRVRIYCWRCIVDIQAKMSR